MTTPPAPPTDVSPADFAAARAACALLDARDAATFARGHLEGAGRLSLAELPERRAELPARVTPVLVVHDDPAHARATAEALVALGYHDVRWLEAPLGALGDGAVSHAPAVPLWRPSPWLEQVLEALPPGRVLDCACGVSREGTFLAMRGWRVEGWDHDPSALHLAERFAERHGVELSLRLVDLEHGEPPLDAPMFDVVMSYRFLHRPALPRLQALVAPGGVFVMVTFLEGQEVFGHPRQPRFLLAPGELAASFPGWHIERSEEVRPPGGPYMARVLARRPHQSEASSAHA